MGLLSKAWKGIKKGWNEIKDYVVPTLIGGIPGLMHAEQQRQAEKASAASEAAAKRQEMLANSAPTTVSIIETTQEADGGTDVTARKRRFSHGKTSRSSGLGLSRYATSALKRNTLG